MVMSPLLHKQQKMATQVCHSTLLIHEISVSTIQWKMLQGRSLKVFYARLNRKETQGHICYTESGRVYVTWKRVKDLKIPTSVTYNDTCLQQNGAAKHILFIYKVICSQGIYFCMSVCIYNFQISKNKLNVRQWNIN